jgi:hypothetical protein
VREGDDDIGVESREGCAPGYYFEDAAVEIFSSVYVWGVSGGVIPPASTAYCRQFKSIFRAFPMPP